MKHDENSNFHHIRLSLTSEQLIELYTWLHDKRKANVAEGRVTFANHPSDVLHTTILAHMLANLDACKKPYVALDDEMVIPVTQDRLEKLAFGGDYDMGTAKSSPTEHLETKDTWDDVGGRPINPDVMAAAAMADEADETNAGETAELDEEIPF